MFDGTIEDLFCESFEAFCGLSQLSVIDGMIISKEFYEPLQLVFLGQQFQFLLSRQWMEGFEGSIDVSVDFHGKYFIEHH